jgi:hypothetical protein
VTSDFSDAATRWCGLAVRLLGWRPGDFWSSTPTELVMSLSSPADSSSLSLPSREMIARLMERDADGKQL